MTLKSLVHRPPQLGTLTARPYRLALASDAAPAVVIAQLGTDDRPGALWGNWFGGGLLIFRRPLRVAESVDAAGGVHALPFAVAYPARTRLLELATKFDLDGDGDIGQ